MIFELAHGRKFPLGNLMFLKLAYLPSKLRFSGRYLFLEYQISAGQLSADSSSTETFYYLNTMRETDFQVLTNSL